MKNLEHKKAFYTLQEVATLFSVSRSKVYLLIGEGKIRAIYLGGRSRRISAQELDRFIGENQ